MSGDSPPRSADTAIAPVPAPASPSAAGACEPYAVVVPYSNRYVVGRPLGSTLPASVAVVSSTALATPVVATGGGATVTKDLSPP